MSPRRTLAWLGVVLLLVPWGSQGDTETPDESIAQRLLGPVGSLAASVQWVRFDVALRDGEHERAYALADTAIALDSGSPQGWLTLARHLVYERGGLEEEPDPERRRGWMRAGLETLTRGEDRSRDPAELAVIRGLILVNFIAEIPDEELGWPGGPRAALEEGLQALERAEELGHPQAHEFATAALTKLGD